MSDPLDEHHDARAATLVARRLTYTSLSIAFSDPLSERWARLRTPMDSEILDAALDLLRLESEGVPHELAPGERGAEDLVIERLRPTFEHDRNRLNEEYEQFFGLMTSKECPPYETEYCPTTNATHRAQALADIAGFYRAFGLEPSRDAPERHDHISLELEFMAWLLAKEEHAMRLDAPGSLENAGLCREASRRFFDEHLAWWAPAFAHALESRRQRISLDPGESYLSQVGTLLAAYIHVERALLGVAPPTQLLAPVPPDDDPLPDCSGCIHQTEAHAGPQDLGQGGGGR